MLLGINHGLHLTLTFNHKVPPALIMHGLSLTQMAEVAEMVADLAEVGFFNNKRSGIRKSIGNLLYSDIFSQIVDTVVEGTPHIQTTDYFLDSNFNLCSQVELTRNRIEVTLNRLHKPTDTDGLSKADSFSREYLHEFDWITQTRQAVIEHIVTAQTAFLHNPMNPLLLNPLTQHDIANALGIHHSTVSRLISGMWIEFPDTVSRELSILVPGLHLTWLQGCYAIKILMDNEEYFDLQEKKWLINSVALVKILTDQFGITVAERTVRKYQQWVMEHLLFDNTTLQSLADDSEELDATESV